MSHHYLEDLVLELSHIGSFSQQISLEHLSCAGWTRRPSRCLPIALIIMGKKGMKQRTTYRMVKINQDKGYQEW
jgi:hypothetical protein